MAIDSQIESPADYSAATLFDDLAARFEKAFDHVPAQVRSINWALSQLPNGAKVVDIGCGTGKPTATMIADAGHHVHGIDISSAMIGIAKAQVQKATFEVADSRTWEPVPADNGTDGVTAYSSFIAGVSQSDIRVFFSRAYAWLRPGGAFVFNTVPVESDNVWIKWMGRDVLVSSLSAEETVKAIEKAGFEVEKQETAMYLPKAAEAGLCEQEDVWEEPQLFVYAKKLAG